MSGKGNKVDLKAGEREIPLGMDDKELLLGCEKAKMRKLAKEMKLLKRSKSGSRRKTSATKTIAKIILVVLLTFLVVLFVGFLLALVSYGVNTAQNPRSERSGAFPAMLTGVIHPDSGRAVDQCGVTSHDGSLPQCGSMRIVPKGKSHYIRPCDDDRKNGTRCTWLVFSQTKAIEISYVNRYLDTLGKSGTVVGEIDGDTLNCRKLEPGMTLMSKTPLILYFSSEDDAAMQRITFNLSAVGDRGDHETFMPGSVFTVNVNKGDFPLYSNKVKNLPDLFAVFQAPFKNLTGFDFTCAPVGTRCCDSVSAYRLSSYQDGGSCRKLTGLNYFYGKACSGGDPVFMFFGPHENVQNETECKFSWASTPKV